MSIAAKVKGLIVPVRKTTSFQRDKAFEKLRQTFKEQGMSVNNLLSKNSKSKQNFHDAGLKSYEESVFITKKEKDPNPSGTNLSKEINEKNNKSLIPKKKLTETSLFPDNFQKELKMLDENFNKVFERQLKFLGQMLDTLGGNQTFNSYNVSLKAPNEPKPMDKVFFHEDRFEIVVNAQDYCPEDIKISIGAQNVEIYAQKKEVLGSTQKSISLKRCYTMPQDVVPDQGSACLSPEGLLLITAPWKI